MMMRFGGQEEEVSFGLIQLVNKFIESTGIGEVKPGRRWGQAKESMGTLAACLHVLNRKSPQC